MASLRSANIVSSLLVLLAITGLAACAGGNDTTLESPPTATAEPTPTATRKPTPTAAPTLTPTPTIAPTPSPMPAPTDTPVPTPTLVPAKEQQVDTTGLPDSSHSVVLPDDEGAHLSPVEWWYFNGHLTTDSGEEFSYHFVTFQSALPSGLTPRLAQVSWVDHSTGLYLTAEQAGLPMLAATSGHFDLPIAGWNMSGDGEDYVLSFQAGEYDVELQAVSRKPATLHDGTGLVDLGVAGKTYYYSRTRLETSGVVSISGKAHSVSGMTWMDHQWGDFTTAAIGWDWLSLNLDDGSDLTVSVVWEQDGHKPITTYGTYVPPDSAPVHLLGEDISLDATGSWTSETTGAVYPIGWTLRIESLGLDLELTPVMENAEFNSSAFIPIVYWEGAVRATGTREGAAVAGKGFVEMVGYAPSVPTTRPTPTSQP